MQPTPKKIADTQILPYNPMVGSPPPGQSSQPQQRKAGEEPGKTGGLVAQAFPPAASPGSAASSTSQATAATRNAPPTRSLRSVPGLGAASVMNQHLSFDGNLKFSGTLTIDCEFRGSVTTDDTLVVGAQGRLDAEVSAGIIEVSGKVHGNIRAKTRVKILTGGEVYGNIETPTISMDDGVVFEGNCSRPSGQAPRSAQPQVELEKTLRHAEETSGA